jgi:chaperone modulatory protein CbpM
MENVHYITVQEFCGYHHIEYIFVNSLSEAGLVQITTINQTHMIPESEMPRLERLIRLHQELDINVAGLEAIGHLLERVQAMQEDTRRLRSRLSLYE